MSFNNPGSRKTEQHALARELKRKGVPLGEIATSLQISAVSARRWTKDIPDISRHSLSDINEESKTAFCSKCQKTVKIWRGTGWICSKSKATRNRRTGNCKICDDEVKLVYDHCHKTGNFRGWICHHCNVGLGFFKDNPASLREAANYLDKV